MPESGTLDQDFRESCETHITVQSTRCQAAPCIHPFALQSPRHTAQAQTLYPSSQLDSPARSWAHKQLITIPAKAIIHRVHSGSGVSHINKSAHSSPQTTFPQATNQTLSAAPLQAASFSTPYPAAIIQPALYFSHTSTRYAASKVAPAHQRHAAARHDSPAAMRRLAARAAARPLPMHFSRWGAKLPACTCRPQLRHVTMSVALAGWL